MGRKVQKSESEECLEKVILQGLQKSECRVPLPHLILLHAPRPCLAKIFLTWSPCYVLQMMQFDMLLSTQFGLGEIKYR